MGMRRGSVAYSPALERGLEAVRSAASLRSASSLLLRSRSNVCPFLDHRLPANSPGALLDPCGTFLGSVLLSLAARGSGGFHGLSHGLTGEPPHHCVDHHISYASHVAADFVLARDSCAKERRAPLGPAFAHHAPACPGKLVAALGAPTSGGLVLYLYLLAPDVLLDRLGAGDHVLADANLFLGNRLLGDHDLFLGDGNSYLVLADLGFRNLALYRNPLHRYFLVSGGNLDAFAVGSHTLTDLELTGLALAGARSELFLGALHPELVLVLEVRTRGLSDPLVVLGVAPELTGLGVALAHSRAHCAGVSGRVIGVAPAILCARGCAQAIVGAHLVLVLGGDLPIVIEGRTVLDRVLRLGYLDEAALFVHRGDVRRDEGGAGAKEAHLHAEVLRLIVLVEEQVVDLTDLRPALVNHGVACVLVFDRCEPVAAFLHYRPPS